MENIDFAIVMEVAPIEIGSRCCVDFVDELSPNEGLFIGNTSSGFIKVLSENIGTETYPSRCFRVNSGAIHQYCYLGEKTIYLFEISPPETIIVHLDESYRKVAVGRVMIEKRN